jgi:multidrug resistance efflux pump
MGRSSGLRVRGRLAVGDVQRREALAVGVVSACARERADPERGARLAIARPAASKTASMTALLTALRDVGRSLPAPRPEPTEPTVRLSRALGGRRRLQMSIAVAIALAAGFMPVRALLAPTSAEAVINARLITLRAPIEGDIAAVPGALPVGTQMQPGALVLRILNRRADRTRLDELRGLIARLEGERNALITCRDALKALQTELADPVLRVKDGNARRRKARILAVLRTELAAAEGTRGEAAHTLARSRSLPLSETGVTRLALDKGRGADLAQRLSAMTSAIDEHEARLASLRGDLGEEIERHSRLASAELIAPVRSAVWKALTAPGQSVVRGQDLVRLLDCSELVVTANVGETAYRRLRIGDPAHFRFRGESADYAGRIIALTGVATEANLALQPAALAEPFRVTVALPGLTAEACAVGRTGRITFAK